MKELTKAEKQITKETLEIGIPLWVSWYDLVIASLNCGI
jgi:hypothetical protein